MPADFVPLDPESQLGYLLVRAADQQARAWSVALRAHGINPRQFSMLAALSHDPGLSQGELARRVMMTPQSVSESLTALKQNGWIARGSVKPGHAAHLRLTADGRSLLARAYPIVVAFNRDSFALLTTRERAGLGQMLRKLIA